LLVAATYRNALQQPSETLLKPLPSRLRFISTPPYNFTTADPTHNLIHGNCRPHKQFESVRNNQHTEEVVKHPRIWRGLHKRLVAASIVIFTKLIDLDTSDNNECNREAVDDEHLE
jgi:hypothetical protein